MADRERDKDKDVKGGAPEDAEQLRGVSGDDDDFDNDDDDLDDEEDTDQEGTF